jgi:formylglycine-generating enzyme required for sulfatase activity
LSETPFDNIATLKNNVEQKFLLDYLKVNFEETEKPALISKSVYLVPFSVLYRHYKSEKSNNKAENIRNILENVASQTGNEKLLLTLLGESQNIANEPFSSIIPYKNIEKGMVKLNEKLYVSDVETTNLSYNLFLQDLVLHKEFDKLNICKSEKVDWRNIVDKRFKDLSNEELFENAKPEDDKCPVQNISYEAAVLYCEWITNVYSNVATKKKFKNVKFYLPSESEWEKAAQGNSLVVMNYPTSNGFQNEKGCYLNNYKLNDDKYRCAKCDAGNAKDGAHFTVQADTYYPNNLGLFNMSGNVAEMISQKGKAKGGSWEDIPENCTIKSVKIYEKPSPAIGFRVFMEIQ